MCLIFLTRGTNQARIPRKMRLEGAAAINELTQNYNLKKEQVPPEDLTLSRVALTLYQVTIYTVYNSAAHLPITPEFISTITLNYPAALMTQAVAAAIPTDKLPHDLDPCSLPLPDRVCEAHQTEDEESGTGSDPGIVHA
ncbi:hypothetical protein MRX96_029714 [Rhipicephalus microplus]